MRKFFYILIITIVYNLLYVKISNYFDDFMSNYAFVIYSNKNEQPPIKEKLIIHINSLV